MTGPVPDLEPVTETEKTDEEKAGCYLMVQFIEGPFSIRYQRVMSKPEPNPLATIAVLQDVIDRLKVALAFQQEVGMAAQMESMQRTMQQALTCPNCKAQLDVTTANKVIAGKVAFCKSCHQKIGG